MTASRKSRRNALAASLAAALVLPAAALAVSPQVRQIYAPLWFDDVIELGPCLFTIALPASFEERCIPWTRRETAGAAFHAATGIVVVGGSDGQLHGLSGVDGKTLYEVSLPGKLVARPTLVDDAAFFGTADAHVLRTDVTSGRVRWDVSVDAEVLEPVTVFEDLVIAITGLDTVYAFDRKTGESRWVHKHPLPTGITLRGQAKPLAVRLPTPQGTQARVYVGHASGRLTVLEADTGRVLDEWGLATAGEDTFPDIDADPLLHGDTLVVASHATGVFGLDPLTGATRWKLEEKGVVRLASGGPNLIVAAGPGKVLGVQTSSGTVRWRFSYERGAPTRPVVKGGRVHIASDRGPLYVLDLASGEPLQYFGSGLGFAADLELDGDMMFAVSTAGRLYALSNAFAGRFQQ